MLSVRKIRNTVLKFFALSLEDRKVGSYSSVLKGRQELGVSMKVRKSDSQKGKIENTSISTNSFFLLS